jgi:hypothetical protein
VVEQAAVVSKPAAKQKPSTFVFIDFLRSF